MTVADESGVGDSFRGHRLMRATTWIVIGTTTGKALNVAATLFVARKLSVDDFGAFSLALGYGGLFSRLASLGLDATVVRELAARPASHDGVVVGSALVVRSVMVAVSLVAAAAGLLLTDPDLAVSSYVAAATVVASLPTTVGLLLNARLRAASVVTTQLAVGVATVLATVVAAAAGAGILVLVAIQSVSTVVAALVIAALAYRRFSTRLRVDREIVRVLVRGMTPLVLTSLAVLVYHRSDIVILGRYRSETELAAYGAAFRVVEAFNLLPLALANVLLPSLSHFSADEGAMAKARRMTDIGYRFLASVALPLAAVGTAVGTVVLNVLYGPDYQFASSVLAVLLWAHYFGHEGVLVHQVLIARGLAAKFTRLSVPAAVVNVGLNLWVIPRWGAIGAAWTSLIAYGTPFVIGAFIRDIADPIRDCAKATIRPLIASILILAVLSPIDAGAAVTAVVAIIVTVVALLVTRSTSVAELRYLASTLRKRAEVSG